MIAFAFETQHALVLLKADLEARKDSVSPQQVKRYSQPLRKANLGQESLWANLEFKVMQVHRDKAPAPDLERGATPCTVVKSYALCNSGMQQRISGPRIDVCPNRIPGFLQLEPYGDNWRQPALDGLIAKDVCWPPPSSTLQDRVEIRCMGDAEDQRHWGQTCLGHPLIDFRLRFPRIDDLAFVNGYN
jgi:hypothetical protein